jgi:hypothetical protein
MSAQRRGSCVARPAVLHAGLPFRLCGAARHCFLSPHGLSNALEWTLCLASPIAPQGAEGRHRLRSAPPVPKPHPQPGQAERKCSGGVGSCCQGCPRCAQRYAALTAPAPPLICGRRLAGKRAWGWGHSGHRWRSRWSRWPLPSRGRWGGGDRRQARTRGRASARAHPRTRQAPQKPPALRSAGGSPLSGRAGEGGPCTSRRPFCGCTTRWARHHASP